MRWVRPRWHAVLLAPLLASCSGAPDAPVQARGRLTIVVAGLPDGMSANVHITGPASLSRTVTSSQTLDELPLGTYTVSAESVEDSAGRFTVSNAVQTAVLTSIVTTASLQVKYQISTGALSIAIGGLPSGLTGNVTVDGPNGFTRRLTSSTVLSKLEAGLYTARAHEIASGSMRFRVADSTMVVDVPIRLEAEHVTFDYGVATGELALLIDGVPAGGAALVDVTGPNGFATQLSGSDTLTGLEPGSYHVTPHGFAAGGESYDAGPPLDYVLSASMVPQTVHVAYLRTTARLALDIRGLPGGVGGAVSITGPNGFTRVAAASESLVGLTRGSYAVSSAPVVTTTGSYGGSPLQQTVDLSAIGSEASVAVTYALLTGSLAVNVSGLPPGVNAAISVTAPDGGVQTVAGTSTLHNLAPGSYVVRASSVATGSAAYSPSPSQQSVTVVVSPSPSAVTVAYSEVTSALAVAITGLPPLVDASVTVQAPDGTTYPITASSTLAPLVPGTYTVQAASVQAGGVVYVPALTVQTVLVTTSSVPTPVTVSYAPASGSLAIAVVGLPVAVNASIEVTGPFGLRLDIQGSTTIGALPPGTYTVTASAVSHQGATYTAAPPQQSVAVAAGATASATVTYTQQTLASVNLTIDGAYVVQVSQTYTGTVPLVAGRQGLLRVFVKASAPNAVQPPVRVRFFDAQGSLAQTLLVPAPASSVPVSVSEGTISASWNVVIDGTLLQPGYRLLADVDPANAVPETNEGDNAFPSSGVPLPLDVRAPSPLRLRFVPVTQLANGLTGGVTSGNASQYMAMMAKLWPLQQIDVDVRSPFTTTAPVLKSDDGNGAWLQILSEINALRSADGSTSYYYGVVKTNYTSGVAGYGYVPGRAAVGWDILPSAEGVAAHEIGHNFSLPHAPCGGAGNPDPNYPYGGGSIGVYGYDIAAGLLKTPANTDIMGYCTNQWVSDYNYVKVLNYRAANPFETSARFRGSMSQSESGMLVWGRARGAQLVIEPAFDVVAPPKLPGGNGAMTLEIIGSGGRMLYTRAFEGEVVADAPDARHFAFVIPYALLGGSEVVGVRVRGPGMRAERTARATTPRAPRPLEQPNAARTAARPDRVSISWTDPAVGGVLVRNARTGEILSFLRTSGAVVRTASDDLELVVSDGVRSERKRVTVQRR